MILLTVPISFRRHLGDGIFPGEPRASGDWSAYLVLIVVEVGMITAAGGE